MNKIIKKEELLGNFFCLIVVTIFIVKLHITADCTIHSLLKSEIYTLILYFLVSVFILDFSNFCFVNSLS